MNGETILSSLKEGKEIIPGTRYLPTLGALVRLAALAPHIGVRLGIQHLSQPPHVNNLFASRLLNLTNILRIYRTRQGGRKGKLVLVLHSGQTGHMMELTENLYCFGEVEYISIHL